VNDWFTVEKIDNSTFAISEYKHWEQVHSYLLIGENAALLIDTGLGIENIKNEVDKLTNLPIPVATTHVHWDHIGGHKLFGEIFVHEKEVDWLRNGIPLPMDSIKQEILKKDLPSELPENFNINKYTVFTGSPTKTLKDLDVIDIGSRKIQVIHTPGHSPGHICFYEKERRYLYTGDLIYLGTLQAFYPSTNPIEFKQSIEKIYKFKNITKILPGHNSLNISTGQTTVLLSFYSTPLQTKR
jgi:glyoxylase-like metal-dependent hydrolase (beta-lactamase superfamily II)